MKRSAQTEEILEEVVSYRGTWIETQTALNRLQAAFVVSYRGTWIETHLYTEQKNGETVVSYRGTWIETGYLGQ